jgi:hypothetical protein
MSLALPILLFFRLVSSTSLPLSSWVCVGFILCKSLGSSYFQFLVVFRTGALLRITRARNVGAGWGLVLKKDVLKLGIF